MSSRTPWLALALALALGAALPAAAQHVSAGPSGANRWSLQAGPGFTASPTAFHFQVGAEYGITPGLGIGPLFQLAANDDVLILAPTANVRYGFDLSGAGDEFVRNLRPYVQGGLGFAYVDRDHRWRDREDTEFLLNGGFGVEYALTEDLALGTGMLFNGMPVDDAAGEDFFFSWQVVSFRFGF